jgi:hypothetical protein
MKRAAWLYVGLGLIALALLIFFGPKRYEGPVLLPISREHAVTAQDIVALVPFLAGSLWLSIGLWQNRESLLSLVSRWPGRAVLLVFAVGIDLGLVLGVALGVLFGPSVGSLFRWVQVGRAGSVVLLLGTLVAALISVLR